jgi:hypothetical protein
MAAAQGHGASCAATSRAMYDFSVASSILSRCAILAGGRRAVSASTSHSACAFVGVHRNVTGPVMAKIEVKKVRATMTVGDLEPHWEAVVDYGEFAAEVSIPLPARFLITDDAEMQRRQSVEAMENLAEALLRFADQTRTRWPRDWD